MTLGAEGRLNEDASDGAARGGAHRQEHRLDRAQPDRSAAEAAPERVKAWRFTTDDLPASARRAAWREVMARLRLPLADSPGEDPFDGEVACLTSPLGMDFALMRAGPQVISGRNGNQPAAVWLVVLLAGDASLTFDGATQALRIGDIAYGRTGLDATLRMSTPFRLLFISAPRVALDHRLIAPLSLGVGRLRGDIGLGQVFSGLLTATANALAALTSDQLRPVELALTEFLVANLAAEDSPAALGGAEAARAAHFHRVCQTIETLLAEPALSLGRVAAADGVSPRSLQKLFAAAGQTFSTYLRTRRLERCRLDLASPTCASLSISEICFRWGFNGSAHFSRTFRDQYGVSPSEFRRNAGADS